MPDLSGSETDVAVDYGSGTRKQIAFTLPVVNDGDTFVVAEAWEGVSFASVSQAGTADPGVQVNASVSGNTLTFSVVADDGQDDIPVQVVAYSSNSQRG